MLLLDGSVQGFVLIWMLDGEGRVRGNRGSRLAKQAKKMRRFRIDRSSLLSSSGGCWNSDMVWRCEDGIEFARL